MSDVDEQRRRLEASRAREEQSAPRIHSRQLRRRSQGSQQLQEIRVRLSHVRLMKT